MINPSKSKEGAQREMGQTGTPHGVPLSGNGMSPATGGLWVLGCCYLFQPRPGGNLRGAATTLPTDSRPGTPAVNARLHLTPSPRSAPGTIRTVRLAHHVSYYADLAESRLIWHPKASKALRRSAVNHRGGPLSLTGVTATQMLD